MKTLGKIAIGLVFATILNITGSVLIGMIAESMGPMDSDTAHMISGPAGLVRAALIAFGFWLPFLIWKKPKAKESDRE